VHSLFVLETSLMPAHSLFVLKATPFLSFFLTRNPSLQQYKRTYIMTGTRNSQSRPDDMTARWHLPPRWRGCHYRVDLLYPLPSASHSQTTAVSKATRLRNRRSGVRIPARTKDYSFLQTTQTGCGTHSISYSLYTGVLSQGPSGRVVTLTTHPHLRPVKKWVELFLYAPIRHQDVIKDSLPLSLPVCIVHQSTAQITIAQGRFKCINWRYFKRLFEMTASEPPTR